MKHFGSVINISIEVKKKTEILSRAREKTFYIKTGNWYIWTELHDEAPLIFVDLKITHI